MYLVIISPLIIAAVIDATEHTIRMLRWRAAVRKEES